MTAENREASISNSAERWNSGQSWSCRGHKFNLRNFMPLLLSLDVSHLPWPDMTVVRIDFTRGEFLMVSMFFCIESLAQWSVVAEKGTKKEIAAKFLRGASSLLSPDCKLLLPSQGQEASCRDILAPDLHPH